MCISKDLNAAILNISNTRENNPYGDPAQNDILYSRWKTRYAETIGGFYADFIKPRLPKKEVVLEWHKLLMDYSQRNEAVFPIRGGYSHNEDKSNEKLRRGWLVRVNDGNNRKFSYTFTDNYFPAYIYKMALDGFCPTPDTFFEFMTKFVEEKDITWLMTLNDELKSKGKNEKSIKENESKQRRFLQMPISYGRISSTELEKNVYINTDPAPTCPLGDCGYKHAHVFGVRGEYEIDSDNVKPWEKIKDKVLLGEESDYTWKSDINNYAWDRTVDSKEADELKKIVVAHFLRLCDPLNHFLSPKQGCNKFTKENGDYSLDIGEYNNLLSYIMFLREAEFGDNDVYKDFKKETLVPESYKSEDRSADIIHIVYHENKQEAADRKNREELAKEEDEKKENEETQKAIKNAQKAVEKAQKDAEKALKKAEKAIEKAKAAEAAKKEAEKAKREAERAAQKAKEDAEKAKKDAETAMSKAASTSRSPKGVKRGSSTEWADFDAYAPKGYSKLIRDIMDELSISDIHELETRIDEAIGFCTNEMNVAKTNGDKNRNDYYGNHRCALNKYKVFMDSKKILS